MSWPNPDGSLYVSDMPCLGVMWSCGHRFSCSSDPASIRHRCASQLDNALFALFMALVVGVLVLAARGVI